VRHLVEVPVLRRRVDLGIGGAGVALREHRERAAAVAGRVPGRGQRERDRKDGEHAAAHR
jgi:hypothetical protein